MQYDNMKLDLGTKVFAVHNNYAVEKRQGGRIKICKVKTFANKKGEIVPILSEIGNTKVELSIGIHKLFTDIDDAINAIRTENDG